jgi:hypothetical protein
VATSAEWGPAWRYEREAGASAELWFTHTFCNTPFAAHGSYSWAGAELFVRGIEGSSYGVATSAVRGPACKYEREAGASAVGVPSAAQGAIPGWTRSYSRGLMGSARCVQPSSPEVSPRRPGTSPGPPADQGTIPGWARIYFAWVWLSATTYTSCHAFELLVTLVTPLTRGVAC